MWVFEYIFFIPITIVYLVVASTSLVYLLMGFSQVVLRREFDTTRQTGGWVALILSSFVIIASSYIYFKWCWLW